MLDPTDEGRRQWLAHFEEQARTNLWLGFLKISEELDLREFGFRGEEPVADAVEFCIERFRTGIA